jgi:hypothetical protein
MHHHAPEALPITETGLLADTQTLRQIVEGLDDLQRRAEQTEIPRTAEQRGYLTPDEDDRVRRGLLAYRNYRLALYEMLLRLEHYPALKPARLRLKAFLVAFVAALTLYSRSLRLDALASRSPLMRGKLNEPEPKFHLEAGFFDEVMAGFSSLRNYGSVLQALWFWGTRRRALRRLAQAEPDPWAWLERQAVLGRRIFHSLLYQVLRSRLNVSWRAFWRTALGPVSQARYQVRSRVGGRFAGYWVHPALHEALDAPTRQALQVRLQTGDVLLMRSEGKLTATLLPGFWSHAALYLGTRDDLAGLGVSPAKDEESHRDSGWVIEAVSPFVRLASLQTSLDADHVLALRPWLPAAERHAAVTEALRHLGKPYDFEFDFNLSSRIVCTGLVYRSFHGRGPIRFQLVKRLGTYTLTGDDLAAQALDFSEGSATGFDIVALILRRSSGWQLSTAPDRCRTLLRRIQRGWRPIRP